MRVRDSHELPIAMFYPGEGVGVNALNPDAEVNHEGGYDAFCEFIEREADRIVRVVQEKQYDYGPKAVLNSPVSPEVGLLTRMFDKLHRLENLIQNQRDSAVGETIGDTLDDVAGYALLWLAYRAGVLDYDPEIR